tara:strand:- start:434 stop:604 length:171 start_codon:yes stop_codon:yes gene_type:complete
MAITQAQYKQNFEGENSLIVATIDNKVMSIPLDPANRHYAAILKWVAEGNTIAEAD